MSSISLRAVSKRFDKTEVIRDVSVDIGDGEFCVLVGPSGSGKSTLLRLIAGLEQPGAGEVHIGERDVTHEPPKRRDIAMVFQSYALYPQMTVAENMGFSLRLSGTEREAARAKVRAAAAMLGLDALLERYPRELSGGQRQRVAMGRAIVREPAVFLFDEPLSNLDAALRVQVRREIVELQRRLRTTAVYVTHDQIEAMSMGDRIVVLRDGRVEQCGTPQALYHEPANRFVAGFIGSPSMNLVDGECAADADGGLRFATPGGTVALPRRSQALPTGGRITLGLRPEHLQLVAAGDDAGAALSLPGEVADSEFSGADTLVLIDTPIGRLAALSDDRCPWHRGDAVTLRADPDRLHLFDADGLRLSRG